MIVYVFVVAIDTGFRPDSELRLMSWEQRNPTLHSIVVSDLDICWLQIAIIEQ